MICVERVDSFEGPGFETFNEDFERIFFRSSPSFLIRKMRTEIETDAFEKRGPLHKKGQNIKLACLHKGKMVGWSLGYQDNNGDFNMANSAVLEEHRRQGLYSMLIERMLKETKEEGYSLVYSNHMISNNQVIIPKLKAGFMVSGFETMDWLGQTLRLSFFHNRTRRKAFLHRVGEETVDEDLTNCRMS